MKKMLLPLVLFSVALVCAQHLAPTGSRSARDKANEESVYTISERGPHHRVIQRVSWITDAKGHAVARTNSYTELTTGMHYWDQGEWKESKEEIEVLPKNAGAIAGQGAHKVIFPPDIYDGQIEMSLPEGAWLRSRVLGLSYFEPESGRNVLIAEITNSVGEIHGNNVVIYRNAFTDFSADLRYTYTREGFEQDVILRDKPPLPEEFGLNPQTVRLQVLTEFFEPPAPDKTEQAVESKTGTPMRDETLQFGAMQMGAGKAFPQEHSPEESVSVGKQWLKLEGRDLLIEEVPVADVLPLLENLPKPDRASLDFSTKKTKRLVAINRRLPARRMAQASNKQIRLAQTEQLRGGFVMDYVTLNTSLTNYVFQGDTTYYFSGNVSLYGTNSTFEGGAVLKYTNNVTLTVNTPVKWLGESYRPVILTARDDNSVGETISGSSGNPGTAYYAANALYFNASSANTNLILQNIRVANATRAISINTRSGHVLRNVQLVNCAYGLALTNAEVSLRNALMAQVRTNFTGSSSTGRVEHLTSDKASRINASIGSNLFITNSLLVLVTNATSFTSVNNRTNSAATGIFTNVGAGFYYLVSGSTNRNVGTTNINATLLADLKKLTTYPPVVYSNLTISVATNWSLQAHRDTSTNDLPDIGYHYDPLDYVFGECQFSTSVTFSAGAAVGWFYGTNTMGNSGYGISLFNGALSFVGTAESPCILAKYKAVQEGTDDRWQYNGFNIGGITTLNGGAATYLSMTHTRCLQLNFQDYDSSVYFGATNSEFWNGRIYGEASFLAYKNCLFNRTTLGLGADSVLGLMMQNCLMCGGQLNISRFDATWPVSITNCAFDGSIINFDAGLVGINCDYNAFLYGSNRLAILGAHDLIVTNTFNWQTRGAESFYLPTNSTLINVGSTNASLLGLYHFTTQTNQLKETNSVVDIGYHYVAVNASGQPFDFDGDGTPDYVEDADGDGIVDAGETEWRVVITNQPQSQTVSPGSSVTFTVGATGTPLYYQWLFNGTNAIAGAMSSSLILNPVSVTNTGIYSVIVSNANGQVVSSNAALTVPCVSQPAGLVAWWQGENSTFDSISNQHGYFVSGSYTNGYQNQAFQFDGTNSYVLIPDSPAQKPTNLTVEAWVKLDTLTTPGTASGNSGIQYFVFKQNSADSNFESFWLGKSAAGGTEHFIFAVNAPGQSLAAARSSLVQTGVWYHLVGVRGPNYVQLYTNGVLAMQTAVTYPQNYGNKPLFIGSSGYAAYDRKPKGRIDEVAFYSRALSSNEVAALYLSGSLGKCPPAPRIIPSFLNALVGNPAAFAVVGSGAAPLSYQWRFNSNNIAGATNATLTFTNLQLTNSGNYSVTLSNSQGVTATSEALLVSSCYPEVDVALVVDRSGSMTEPAGSGLTRIQAARTACSNFVQSLNFTNDQVALISFATDVTTDQTLTNNQPLLLQKIGQLSADGETYMGNALLAAQLELTSNRHHSNALPVLVFLTDGDPDDSTNSILGITAQIKNSGTHLITIGLGTNLLSSSTNLLRAMASTPGNFHQATNTIQLTNIYNQIADAICRSPTNQPPVVSWVSPTNNQLFISSPTNILLWATNHGGIMTDMFFYNGSVLLGSVSNSPYQFLWQNVTNGTYTLQVKGTNSDSGVSVSSTNLTLIVNAMPVITNNAPTNIQAFNFIGSVNVGLTNTAWDPDGSVTNVTFYTWTNGVLTQVPGTVISNDLKWALMWNGLTNGYYSYYAVATDNRAAKSSSPIGVFKVDPTNTPPQVWITYPTNLITYPTNNLAFRAGADITITADVSPGSGPVTNVEFFVNGRLLGSDAQPPYGITACCWEQGTHTIFAKAIDDLGGTKVSTNVMIVVDPKVPTGGEGYWDSEFANATKFLYAAGNDLGIGVAPPLALGVAMDGSLYLKDWDGGNELHRFDTNLNSVRFGPNGEWGKFVRNGTNLYTGITVGNSKVAKINGTNLVEIGDEIYSVDQSAFFLNGLHETHDFCFLGGEIYVAGNFANENAQYIARLDVTNNRWISFAAPLNGPVHAFAEYQGKLIVGGAFTYAGGNSNVNYIAMLDGTNWLSLGEGLTMATEVTNEWYKCGVTSLAVCGTNLFVGGNITAVGSGESASGVAVWDGVNWRTLNGGVGVSDWFSIVYGWSVPRVNTLAVRGNRLFIGGEFDTVFDGVNVISAYNIASATWSEVLQKWVWSALDEGVWFPDLEFNGMVTYLTVQEGDQPHRFDLLVTGYFQYAGETLLEVENYARWRVGYPQPDGPPKVTLTTPANFTVFTNYSTSPTNIVLSATVTSTTNITSVNFTTNGAPVISGLDAENGSYTNLWYDPPIGIHLLKAVAKDADNLPGESKVVVVIVKSETNSLVAKGDAFTIRESSPRIVLPVLTNDLSGSPKRLSQVLQTRFNLGRAELGHDGSYIAYTPLENTYGTDIFQYAVTNTAGEADFGVVQINILAYPEIQITSPNDQQRTNPPVSGMTITGTTRDWDGSVSNVSVFTNGVLYKSFAPTGINFTTNWSQSTPGYYTFTAVATDNDGLSSTSAPVTVVVTTTSVNPPVAIIANLTETNTTQSGLTSVTLPVIRDGFFQMQGTASGDSPVAYQVLLYRPDDWEDIGELSELIAQGYEPFANITPPGTLNAQGFRIGSVVNGNLGTNDLTSIPNGIYDLVLRVRGGTDEALDIVRVQIDSQLKIGQFSFSEQDLVLPVNGIPLTVTRTYNSLNPRSADFGYSWTYALNSMDVEIDEERVTVTALDTLDDGDLPDVNPMNFSMRVGGGRNVTLTLPDGRRTTFQFTYAKTTSAEDCPSCYDGEWIAPPGVNATLTTLNPADKHNTGDDTVIALFSPLQPYWQASGPYTPLEAYDIPTLVLTNEDGTAFFITRDVEGQESPTYVYQDDAGLLGSSYKTYYIKPHPGKPKLTKIVQRSGDYLVISDTGVTHYDKNNNPTRSMFMQRDAAGRVTAIFDPISGVTNDATALTAKALVKYVYNRDTGNLIQVHRLQDRTAGTYLTTKYHYDHPQFPHYITSIEDPRGIPLARNEYDDSGRLTAVVDADGKRTEFIHSTTNNAEIIIDQLGYGSTNFYNLRGNVTAIVNALGETNQLAYDDNDRLSYTVDALGHTNSFGYDAYGYRNAITNALGKATLSLFNQYGALLAKTNALLNVIGFEYDTLGKRTAVIDALGHPTAFAHDAHGRPTAVTNALNQLRAMAGSDSMGDLQYVSQVGGIRMDLGHDANGSTTNTSFVWVNPDNTNQTLSLATVTEFDAANRVTRVTEPDGQVRLTVYDNGGRVAQNIDRMGNTNSYLYDARGNLVETTYSDGAVTRSVYDARQQVLFAVDRHLPGSPANGTHNVYDPLGRAIRTERIANVQIDIVQDGVAPRSVLTSTGVVLSASSTVYDEGGRVRFTTNALGYVMQYEYDAVGKQTAIIDALTNRTDFAYDDAGQLRFTTNALGYVTRYDYDAKGRRVKTVFPDNSYTTNCYNEIGQLFAVRDQAGLTNDFEFDALGRMKAVIKPQVFDPQGGTNARPRYEYEYDKFGNILVIRDSKGRETKFTYDAFGQLISKKLPLQQTNFHAYNALGQLDYSVDFKGQTNRFVYDSRGRMVTNYLYAAGAMTPSQTNIVEYGTGGQFIRTTRPEGVTTVYYNIDGAVTNIVFPESTIGYEYEAVAGYLKRAYTTNSDLRYAYDELGRLKTVSVFKRNGTVLGSPEVTTNTYTKLGSLENVYFPNGTRTFYQYNVLNHLTNLVHYNSASQVLARYEYTVASDGQRLASVETRRESGGTYSTTQVGWTNDALRRLVAEVSTSTVAALNFTNRYVYDLAGNRLWKTNVAGAVTVVTAYTNNANDQLLGESSSAGSFTNYYDTGGSLTNRSSGAETNLFTYNLEGRLASAVVRRLEGSAAVVQTNRYYYNGAGIRVREETARTVNGGAVVNETNIFVNDPQNLSGFSQVLEELPAVGATPRVSYTLGNQIIAQEKSGTVSCLMFDGHGSTRLLTDASGVISDRYSYDGYGLPLDFQLGVENPPRTKMLYTGEQFDAGLGQYYLRARYYNPSVGRFSAMDQVEGNPSEPLTLHKYAYCQNNPVNGRDPSGNFTLVETASSIAMATTIEKFYVKAINWLGDMLRTSGEASAESIGAMEEQEATSDAATIIVHGVEGLSFSGGHKLGWSKPFQSALSTNAPSKYASSPLQHDFYEFNWGGFSTDMDAVAVTGFVAVKSVHQLAYVHLHIAQTLIWMKGYSDMNVISHSWGTTLAYDMLRTGGIEMKHWVSMGSPLNPDITKPVWNSGLWINAYSKRDPIVYFDMYPRGSLDGWIPVYAPRFGGNLFSHPQVDIQVNTTSPGLLPYCIGEHGAYWEHTTLINTIRGNLQ